MQHHKETWSSKRP